MKKWYVTSGFLYLGPYDTRKHAETERSSKLRDGVVELLDPEAPRPTFGLTGPLKPRYEVRSAVPPADAGQATSGGQATPATPKSPPSEGAAKERACTTESTSTKQQKAPPAPSSKNSAGKTSRKRSTSASSLPRSRRRS